MSDGVMWPALVSGSRPAGPAAAEGAQRMPLGVVRRPPTDLGFHVDLCRATHNPVLLVIVRWVIAFYARSGQIPVRQDTDHHAEIFEAVRAGDAEAARLAMQRHLQWVRDRL